MAHQRRKPRPTARTNQVSVHPMIARAVGTAPATARHGRAAKHHEQAVLANDPAGILVMIVGALMMLVLTPLIALWTPTGGAGSFWMSLLALIVFTNGANIAGAGARMADRSFL